MTMTTDNMRTVEETTVDSDPAIKEEEQQPDETATPATDEDVEIATKDENRNRYSVKDITRKINFNSEIEEEYESMKALLDYYNSR